MISFNVPPFVGDELKFIEQAVKAHKISGDGSFTKKCNSWLENKFRAQKVLLTTSGTSALDMAMLLCKFQPGDEPQLQLSSAEEFPYSLIFAPTQ